MRRWFESGQLSALSVQPKAEKLNAEAQRNRGAEYDD
jgi:hypothetical protein